MSAPSEVVIAAEVRPLVSADGTDGAPDFTDRFAGLVRREHNYDVELLNEMHEKDNRQWTRGRMISKESRSPGESSFKSRSSIFPNETFSLSDLGK